MGTKICAMYKIFLLASVSGQSFYNAALQSSLLLAQLAGMRHLCGMFLLVVPKQSGILKISFLGPPEVQTKERKKKACVNKGHLRLRPQPCMVHASHLDQNHLLPKQKNSIQFWIIGTKTNGTKSFSTKTKQNK